MMSRFLACSLAAAACLSIAPTARAAFFTVGSDFACSFSTIQAALDQAASAPGNDVIRVAKNQSYTAQALISNATTSCAGGCDVEIVGGFDDCSDASSTANTLISGAGGAEAPVLSIRGAAKTVLRNISFIRGDASMVSGEGGGVRVENARRVELYGVVLSQNRAARGGGLDFLALRPGDTLLIGTGTQIALNQAQFSGGGLRVHGPARVMMEGFDTAVINNEATGVDPVTSQFSGGYGGGILIEAPAVASVRLDGSGGLSGNLARYGGGIAIRNLTGSGSNNAVQLDSPNTLRIANNIAGVAGGGVWIDAASTDASGSDTEVCLGNFRFDGNRAPIGAAIHAGKFGASANGDPSRVRVALNRNCTFPTGGPPIGFATTCARAGTCGVIAGQAGNPASLLRLGPGASLAALRVAFVGNTVQRLVDAQGAFDVALSSCLATGNVLADAVLRMFAPQGVVTFDECTIAGNTIGGTYVLEFPNGGALALRNSILWQPAELTVSPAGGGAGLGASVESTMVSERTTVPVAFGFVDGPPAFNDPVVSDYRLRVASRGIDAASVQGGDDVLFKPRDRRIQPAAGAIRDIGAHERQPADPMLVNGSFYGGLSQWSIRGAPWVTYDAAGNDGTDGTGAATLSVPSTSGAGLPQIEVIAQCFVVPFPGTWRTGARAAMPGTLATRDIARLAWRLRMSSEECTGASDAGGETFFPGFGSAFLSATAADIVVPAAGFGPGTTIEIVGIVAQNTTLPGALSASFDNFSLTSVGSGMFSDGFESP